MLGPLLLTLYLLPLANIICKYGLHFHFHGDDIYQNITLTTCSTLTSSLMELKTSQLPSTQLWLIRHDDHQPQNHPKLLLPNQQLHTVLFPYTHNSSVRLLTDFCERGLTLTLTTTTILQKCVSVSEYGLFSHLCHWAFHYEVLWIRLGFSGFCQELSRTWRDVSQRQPGQMIDSPSDKILWVLHL